MFPSLSLYQFTVCVVFSVTPMATGTTFGIITRRVTPCTDSIHCLCCIFSDASGDGYNIRHHHTEVTPCTDSIHCLCCIFSDASGDGYNIRHHHTEVTPCTDSIHSVCCIFSDASGDGYNIRRPCRRRRSLGGGVLPLDVSEQVYVLNRNNLYQFKRLKTTRRLVITVIIIRKSIN